MPLQMPVRFPQISAIIALGSPPLARKWPCPRWVLVIQSVSRSRAQDAGGDRLLADVQMNAARQIAGGGVSAKALLHFADEEHSLIERSQLVTAGSGVCSGIGH